MSTKYLILTLLFILPLTTALGVGQEFHENQTLILAPGQEYPFEFTLQNEENETINVLLNLTGEYATLQGETTRELAPNSVNNRVIVEVNVPRDAEPASTSKVTLRVAPTSVEDGQVGMSYRINTGFTVQVEGEPVKRDNTLFWYFGAAIILVIIILVVLKLRK